MILTEVAIAGFFEATAGAETQGNATGTLFAPCGTAPLSPTSRLDMFSVKTLIRDDALVGAMKAMRTWLDENRIEPTTFHYEFTSIGIECRIDFSREEAAVGFATAFDGTVMTAADISGPPE